METVTLRADVAAKLIGKNPDELAGLLEGVDENKTSDVFADAVAQNFSALRDKIVKDKYNQGIKEKGKAIETALKPLFEKYEISDFDTAEKGISLLAEKMEQDGSKTIDLSTLTAEQLKELPLVQKLQGQITNLTQAKEAAEQSFEQFKTEQVRTAAYNSALTETISLFEEQNAITGNASKAEAAKMFLQTISKDKIGLDESGKPVILGDDGNPIQDKFGKTVPYSDYVLSNYTFGFNPADPNKGGSGAGAGKKGGSSSSGIVIQSKQQGEAAIKAAFESNDKKALSEARKAYSDFLTNTKE